jgi:succinate dehydrogenase / fumarate reductase cytochrome b subunit
MSVTSKAFLGSSIFRKQVIALTGLVMIGFVLVHLSGNLLIYAGPDVFNGYSANLHKLGALLWVARFGLIAAFVLHVWLTLLLVKENRAARPQAYEVDDPKGDRAFAAAVMKYTGLFIAAFLLLHLYDFTFGSKTGPQSVIAAVDAGKSLGLFGLVWNSFKFTDPIGWIRVPIYIIAVSCVGMHLSHAIQSVFQTFGFHHARFTPLIRHASLVIGALVALAFAMIPIYVMVMPTPWGI